MLVASVQTDHGRSTPLLWRTWKKSELKGQLNNHEDELLAWLRRCVPEGVQVVIVTDQGFGDQKLFRMLMEELHFDFIIRFKQDTLVTDAQGLTKKASDWMAGSGRLRRYEGAAGPSPKAPDPKDSRSTAAGRQRGGARQRRTGAPNPTKRRRQKMVIV